MVCDMHTDSSPEWIPIAEALVAWSEPALIEAIRNAEATTPDGYIIAAGWYTVEALPQERRAPLRSRAMGKPKIVTGTLVPLWEQVFARFRWKIEKGEVVLRGTVRKEPIGDAEPMPAAIAASYEFDPPSDVTP